MVTFAEGVKNALRTFPCFALRNGEYAYGFASKIFPLSPAGSVADGIGQLRRLIGCDPADDPVEPAPPFFGGQCPVFYVATFQQRVFSQAQQQYIWSNTITSPQVLGPVSVAGGPTGGQCSQSGETAQSWVVRDGNGNNAFQLASGCADVVPSYRQLQFSRVDGQPDNCGNPPVDFPPPTNIDVDIDVTYNIEDGPDTTVTIPFTFSPVTVDFSGNFSAPFTFNFGGFEFSGTLELSPNIEININPPTAPRGGGDGVDDLPAGDPDDDVDPVPPSEKVIGVAITSVLVGEQQLTTIATENIPAIYAPRAGSVKFAYSLGVSTFWSSDIDIKDDRTFIPCPFSQGADFVAVSPAPGVDIQWRAITGYPLATIADVS